MKILKELRKAIDRNADYCEKELETIRSQETLENSFTETKAELKSMNSRMNNAEERISDLEDRLMVITQSEQQAESQMKKKKKNESNVRDLWDNIKHANLCIIGIPEEKKEKRGLKMYLKKLWLKPSQT